MAQRTDLPREMPFLDPNELGRYWGGMTIQEAQPLMPLNQPMAGQLPAAAPSMTERIMQYLPWFRPNLRPSVQESDIPYERPRALPSRSIERNR